MNSKRKHIEVVSYNSNWPKMFEVEAAQLMKALGNNAIAVHHVGSTSVPGLASKPVIDMIAVIKDKEKAVLPLEALGYQYKGEYNIPLRLYFNKKEGGDVNLHVYEEGHPEIELNLLFRDYLRTHPVIRDAYAQLKDDLLKDPASFEKNHSLFVGYTLGKHAFIQGVLRQAGFNRIRFMRCTHDLEWEAAKSFRQKYFFDKVPIADPYTWTFDHPDHVHFVLYQGVDIIGYAHLELWPKDRTAIRIIVIDEVKRRQGFGEKFLTLLEAWLKSKGYKSIHAESSPQALGFYQCQGYVDMPFQDPGEHESSPKDIPVGKML
jgi:GrpB-like predicted nucleotidyltransferase (UPF0157 family)